MSIRVPQELDQTHSRARSRKARATVALSRRTSPHASCASLPPQPRPPPLDAHSRPHRRHRRSRLRPRAHSCSLIAPHTTLHRNSPASPSTSNSSFSCAAMGGIAWWMAAKQCLVFQCLESDSQRKQKPLSHRGGSRFCLYYLHLGLTASIRCNPRIRRIHAQRRRQRVQVVRLRHAESPAGLHPAQTQVQFIHLDHAACDSWRIVSFSFSRSKRRACLRSSRWSSPASAVDCRHRRRESPPRMLIFIACASSS